MKTPKKKRKDEKGYGHTAKRGAAWSIIRQGGHELIAVPMSMVMARLLTPADFGVAVAASFFILLASRVTQMGFGAAIVRIKELRPEHTSSVFVVSFVLGAINYAILFLAAPYIGRFFESPESGALVRVAALTFLITPFGSVANALNSRHMQFRYIAIADWTDTLVGAVATVALALRGWSYWSIAYGQIIATGVRVVLQMYLAGWRPSVRFSRPALQELLSYGLGVQTKRLLEYASANADNLVVGRMLDMSALGFYDKAFSTMNRLVNRLTLGQAPFRIFSIIHEDRERFQRAYTRLVLSITMIGYPAFITCVVVAGPLFEVLYGRQWSAAVLPFQVLCIGGMLKLLNAYASQANEAAGAIWSQARRQGIGTVLVLIGAALGAWRAGILGAAIGVTVAMVVLTLAMQDLVRRATGLSWRQMLAPQVPALVCATIVAGAAWLAGAAMTRWAPGARSVALLGAQMGAAIVCYAVFVLFNRFAALRDVVDETLRETVPARVLGWLNRMGIAAAPAPQS